MDSDGQRVVGGYSLCGRCVAVGIIGCTHTHEVFVSAMAAILSGTSPCDK